MIEGIRRSGIEKKIWRHNEVAHLEELLAAEADLRSRREIRHHDLSRRGQPYHDDVLIDQLAEALTDVWRRVALPLEGCVIDAAE
jgi:hypothetical protein